MVDKALLAKKIAAVTDAVSRIREVLPPNAQTFALDRTTREVVILNLFVALQDCVSLAAHCLADRGVDVPAGYREIFLALANDGVVEPDLAQKLAAASGLRNLIAHQYGALDWDRIFDIASNHLDDLLTFCQVLAQKA